MTFPSEREGGGGFTPALLTGCSSPI